MKKYLSFIGGLVVGLTIGTIVLAVLVLGGLAWLHKFIIYLINGMGI